MMTAPSQPVLRGELRFDESLKRYNSWRVGGAARQLYLPADSDDLAAFLRTLPSDEPLLWLGLGSNLLIRDGGFDGTVIVLQGRLNGLVIEGSQSFVHPYFARDVEIVRAGFEAAFDQRRIGMGKRSSAIQDHVHIA